MSDQERALRNILASIENLTQAVASLTRVVNIHTAQIASLRDEPKRRRGLIPRIGKVK